MGIIYNSRDSRLNERRSVPIGEGGGRGISARRSFGAIVRTFVRSLALFVARRSDRLTVLQQMQPSEIRDRIMHPIAYFSPLAMTSPKIAGGVTRDTSYLAYLAIAFHTSPIHNIFIVQALYESPVQLHRPGIIGRYLAYTVRSITRRNERTTNLAGLAARRQLSNVLSWVEVVIYAGNWTLHRYAVGPLKEWPPSFSFSPFITKMNCLSTICFARIFS